MAFESAPERGLLLPVIEHNVVQHDRGQHAERNTEQNGSPAVAERGGATLDRVAQQLGVSVRSLQRRCAGRGFSFQAVPDEVRAEVATALLRTTTMQVAQVGCLAGFADTAAFVRAFKRWRGQTPSEFRRGPQGLAQESGASSQG